MPTGQDRVIADREILVPEIAVTHAIVRATASSIGVAHHRLSGQLDITIMVAGGAGISLEGELALVRSALLYADHVTLCSPRTSMLAATSSLPNLSASERLDLLLEVLPVLSTGPEMAANIQAVRDLHHKRRRTRDELLLMRRLDAQLDKEWQPLFSEKVEEIMADAGGGELATALEAGVLSVDPLLAGLQKPEVMTDVFFARLQEAVADASSYVMFDELATGLLTSALAEGVIAVPQAAAVRQDIARLGTEIVAHLPAFPSAHIDDVLAARDGLHDEMLQFRRAVSRLRELAKASALDPNFSHEADRIYATEVEPALVEINRILEASPVTAALVASGTVAGMALAFLAAPALPELVRGLFAVALAGGAVGMAQQGANMRQAEARGNDLFLLYEVQRRLEIRKSLTIL